ncbi:conserved hypothetical protein [Alkaliphilus metalliredigens QYMF]|uniref:DUF2935 domain-containing protein n=1 Tax=Alkaliphilus metalliredigens (strain QYMF) TaxID=293826 RepID=A6TX11_ALKMQ|nr:DUF2935 domain-containing protein [Alkaliphilus metalliredigens]ABR50729.1 conserved hypothetical protein [Alkaliphilus metalliredigens QYMF]
MDKEDILPYENVALFEHQFWLQVLGDHARFILNALSPEEREEIQRAQYFIHIFDQLLEESRKSPRGSALSKLTDQAYGCAQEIRTFKLHLIKRHLVGKIEIGLPPTFLNHMVNEVEEYLRILCFLSMKQIPITQPIHYHMVWLLDAAGHSAGIMGDLDMVEKELIRKSGKFTQRFEEFYIKAVEIAGYTRTTLDQFPAFTRFNYQVEGELLLFKKFLRELEALELNQKVLGTLSALMLDHMAREECYYLTKLAQVTEVKEPKCDPTKARTEA